ncbi:hypothetical protein HDU97_006347 [Phlyctochytrium planicorne]|nr:hypothetical protein HDU97_006347 [Phlyctochytrium planicorne]
MSNNSSHRSRSSSSSSTDNNNNTNSNPVKRLNSKRPQNFINQAPRILASIAREEARAEASHSASTSTGGKAKKNLPKSKTQKALEAGRIPRPPNAFILYRIDKQKEVVEEMREYKLNSMDMSKAWAAKWKAESDEVKQTYKDRAVAIREALFQKHPEFTFKPWKRDAGMVKNSNGYFDSYDSRFHVTTMEDAATRGRKKKVAPPPKAGKRKGKKSRSPSTSDSDGGYFRRSLSPLTDEDTEMEESYPDQIFHDTRSQPADIDSSACNPTAFIPAEHPEALICEGSIMSAGNLFSSVPSNLGDSLLPEHNVGFQPLGEASMTASQVFHSESQMPFFSNPLGSGQDKQAFDSSAISNASLSMQVSMLPPPSTASQQFVFQQQDAEGRWIPLQVPSQIDPGVWKSVEELLGADGSFGEGASSMSFADVPFNAIKDYVPSFPALDDLFLQDRTVATSVVEPFLVTASNDSTIATTSASEPTSSTSSTSPSKPSRRTTKPPTLDITLAKVSGDDGKPLLSATFSIHPASARLQAPPTATGLFGAASHELSLLSLSPASPTTATATAPGKLGSASDVFAKYLCLPGSASASSGSYVVDHSFKPPSTPVGLFHRRMSRAFLCSPVNPSPLASPGMLMSGGASGNAFKFIKG